MSGNAVVALKDFKQPDKVGTHYRLVCMTGEQKGKIFYLHDERIVMGRGDKVEIKVLDNKSSREHVELKKIGNDYIATDLKSANGTIINDLPITQHQLADGDKIVIGKTVFKYNVLEILPGVIAENDQLNDDDRPSDLGKKDGKSKSKIGMVAIFLLVVSLLFEEEDKVITSTTKTEFTKDISKELQQKRNSAKSQTDKENLQKVNAAIHRGVRDYREGHYLRALKEFDFAKTLDPHNARAINYITKCQHAFTEDVKTYLYKAKMDEANLRFTSAITSYCAIVKMLEEYQEEEENKKRYNDAISSIKNLNNLIGMNNGEIKCYKEQ